MALCHHSPALLGVTLIRRLGQGGWMPTCLWLPRGPFYSLEQGVETLTPRPNWVHHVFLCGSQAKAFFYILNDWKKIRRRRTSSDINVI